MKKIYFLIVLVCLLLLCYEIATTYAKYSSNASGTAEKQAGAWIIKVNNKNVAASGVQNFSINSLEYPSNEYVLENKMAPSSSGYFDIVFDGTGNSTAIRFDVTLNFDELNISEAIHFQNAYKVVNGVEQNNYMVRTAENTYSGIISLADVTNEVLTRVRFYVEWENDTTGQSDEADSVLGLSRNISLEIPVTVNIKQYVGEQLTAYNNTVNNTVSNTASNTI